MLPLKIKNTTGLLGLQHEVSYLPTFVSTYVPHTLQSALLVLYLILSYEVGAITILSGNQIQVKQRAQGYTTNK